MPVVTGITEHPRRAGRFVVDVDGHEVAVVGVETLATLKVRLRDDLSDGQLAALREATSEFAAYDRALGLLAARARSVRELRRRLLQKGAGEPAAAVDAALSRLLRAGLLDDAAYARQLARSRVTAQGASRRRVRQELFKRGVASELADAAIADVFAEESVDERELVERAARKRAAVLGSLDPTIKRRRLYAYLARRGYEAGEIVRALEAVLGAVSGER